MELTDVRFVILLWIPIHDLAHICQTDKLFEQICNSNYFWKLKYPRLGIDPPENLNLIFSEHLLYIYTMQYINILYERSILIIQFDFNGEEDIINKFAITERKIIELIEDLIHQGEGTLIIEWNEKDYIASITNLSGCTELENLDVKTVFKIIQFSLMINFPITILSEYYFVGDMEDKLRFDSDGIIKFII
jgi:hypothetical protein